MQKIIIIILLLVCANTFAQERGGGKMGKGKQGPTGEVFGQVSDSATAMPMEYVSVSVINQKTNIPVGGGLTNAKGKFNLVDIKMGTYVLRFDFVGYTSKTVGPFTISKEQLIHDMDRVNLSSTINLDEVVIDGKKSEVSYEIDKKVINVADQDTEVSQSAVELLENVPSVSVDNDGNVSLRGNQSFTLLIDGIPSALDATDALNSIPASTVENIEIITNASAKYEAEGVSGIINIVTKKKKLEGTSMLANVNVGTFDNYGGDISVNIREKKFGINLGANLMNRNRPREGNSLRTNITDAGITEITSEGDDYFTRGFTRFNGEVSYTPNSAHYFSVGGTYGIMNFDNGNAYQITEMLDGAIIEDFISEEISVREFFGFRGKATYRHNVKRDKKHYIEFNSIIRSRDGDELSDTRFFNPQGGLTDAKRYTETGPTNLYRFNVDYSKTFTSEDAIEFGTQIQFGKSGDDGKVSDFDFTSESYIVDPLFSSEVDYTRDIMALYALYRGSVKKLGYQVGFRTEQTDRNISSVVFEDFKKISRLDYFPSAHLSYDLGGEQQVMLSYSRRINRPRSWYFEPFVTWISPFQVRSGNPNLEPEYIDAIELNWNKGFGKKGNVALETYFRKIDNVINRINNIYEGNILINSPVNVGESTSIGIEPSFNYKLKKWWRMNLGFNFYDYTIKGQLNNTNFDQHSFNWNARMNNTFNLKKNWRLQFSPQYTGPTVLSQGDRSGFFAANFSIKKSFSDGVYSLGLQGRNIFDTSVNESNLQIENLSVYEYQTPKFPIVSISFSVKLNNYKQKMDRGAAQEDDF